MLFIVPISTEEHDGRIRLAALLIIVTCLIIQLLITFSTIRTNAAIDTALQNYALQHPQQAPTMPQDIRSLLSAIKEKKKNSFIESQQQNELAVRIKSIRHTSLVYQLGLIPGNFKAYTLITYMFAHSGWIHLLGNLLFFYVLGLTMERYWKFWRFLGLYLLFGVGASLFFIIFSNFTSEAALDAPLVGASGAVAGIMGAFCVTHPHAKINIFYLFLLYIRPLVGTFPVPSYLYLSIYFILQLGWAIHSFGSGSGVAYTAHIGGFLLGLIFGKVIKSHETALHEHSAVMHKSPTVVIIKKDRLVPTLTDEIDETPKAIAMIENGWCCFTNKEYENARQSLSQAVSTLLLGNRYNTSLLRDTIGRILEHSRLLDFSLPQLFHWAGQCREIKMVDMALLLYDFLSQQDDNDHLKKKSLLQAALVRIDENIEIDIARRCLSKVIALDDGGIFAQHAQDSLKKLSMPL